MTSLFSTKNLTNLDLAYAAGLIDGEGYIGITRSNQRNRIQFGSVLQINMTSKETIDWLHKAFGGTVNKVPEREGNREVQYKWILLAKNDLVVLLPELIPYLKLKKIHAEVLLTFFRYVAPRNDMSGRRGGGRGSGYTEDQRTLQEKFYNFMSILNSKGIGSNELKASAVAFIRARQKSPSNEGNPTEPEGS